MIDDYDAACLDLFPGRSQQLRVIFSGKTEILAEPAHVCTFADVVKLFNSLSTTTVSRPLTFSWWLDVGTFLGVMSFKAFAIARMCSGVVPQHPPAILINPSLPCSGDKER